MNEAANLVVILIRHGRSARSLSGNFGRTFDADLDPNFNHLMTGSRDLLFGQTAHQLFSSPLCRCFNTLRYIYGADCTFTKIEEFRAYHSGKFEGQTDEYVRQQFPGYSELSYRDRFLEPKHGEESIFMQARRVSAGIHRMLDSVTAKTITVATHFSVINIIASLAAGVTDTAVYADGKYEISEGGSLTIDITAERLRTAANHVLQQ